jgi:predicted small lipoprotein YifL
VKKVTVSLAFGLLLALGLTGCGYDGHYRYPCQDPTNWELEECKPPICTVNGACPVDLIGPDVVESETNE